MSILAQKKRGKKTQKVQMDVDGCVCDSTSGGKMIPGPSSGNTVIRGSSPRHV